MKRTTMMVILSAALLALVATPALAQPAAKSPTQTYMDFVAAAGTAKSLADVLPFVSAEWRRNLEGLPKERQALFLESFKDVAGRQDLKITKETISGAKCELAGTAKNKQGWPLTGKVHLLKEGAAWKIDDHVWTTTQEAPGK
jgi:hypothetical protein